jgi:6-phosphogluconolactonase (cycloisomerase 2 family)
MQFTLHSLGRATSPLIALLAMAACGGGGHMLPPTYSIGGTVSGIDAGKSLILRNNGGDALTVNVNGAFSFVTKIASGGAYAVTATAPQGETCTVTAGSGTAAADVTSVAVSCNAVFSVGGSVSGLVGKGLVLELSATDVDQVLAIGANGQFAFMPTVNSGGRYLVSIKQQPSSPAQSCVVGNGSFAAGGFLSNGSDITDVGVVCGEFAYVTNAADNTISAFSVDANTGAITSVGAPAIAGQGPSAIANTIYTGSWYVYVVNGASNDVSAFVADAGSGALVPVPGSPFTAGSQPSAAAIYAVINAGDYSPPPQRLKYYLYVANLGSDDLSAYGIDRATGVPTPLSPVTYATGAGPSVVAIQPRGGFLYVADTGGSSDISAFSIDGLSGGLKPVVGSPFLSGGNVRSLVFAVDGKFLYAADASGAAAAIYGFSVDPSTGALTSLGGLPLALPSCDHIVTDQTGAYLYAAAGTSVFGYSIDRNTGALSPLPGFPLAAGANATTLSIDSTNQYLYAGNAGAGTVSGFALNAATGALTTIPGSPFAVGSSADFIVTF